MLLCASFLIDSTSLKSEITSWIDIFKICNDPGHPDDRWGSRRTEALHTVRDRMTDQIDLRSIRLRSIWSAILYLIVYGVPRPSCWPRGHRGDPGRCRS